VNFGAPFYGTVNIPSDYIVHGGRSEEIAVLEFLMFLHLPFIDIYTIKTVLTIFASTPTIKAHEN